MGCCASGRPDDESDGDKPEPYKPSSAEDSKPKKTTSEEEVERAEKERSTKFTFGHVVLHEEVAKAIESKVLEITLLKDMFELCDHDKSGFLNDEQKNEFMDLFRLTYETKLRERDEQKSANEQSMVDSPVGGLVTSKSDEDNDKTPVTTVSNISPRTAEEDSVHATHRVPPLSEEEKAKVGHGTGPTGKRRPKVKKFLTHSSTAPTERGDGDFNEEHLADEVPTPAFAVAAQKDSSLQENQRKDQQRPVSTRFIANTSADEDSGSGGTAPSNVPVPNGKQGFLAKRSEGEDVSAPRTKRFFTLENGQLSFMESTSKRPPFSMSKRILSLRGLMVQTNGNNLIIIDVPRDAEGAPMIPGDFEAVELEATSENEVEPWMSALKNHIEYATSRN